MNQRLLAAIVLLMGIVLSPLNASAATMPVLVASIAAVVNTTTMQLGAPAPVRREAEGGPRGRGPASPSSTTSVRSSTTIMRPTRT